MTKMDEQIPTFTTSIYVRTHYVHQEEGTVETADEIRAYWCVFHPTEDEGMIILERTYVDKYDLEDADHGARYKIIFDDDADDFDDAKRRFGRFIAQRMKARLAL